MSDILSLLTNGYIYNNESINQSSINKKLYPIGYTTVLWYDRSIFILKDLNDIEGNVKIKEEELKNIITKIIENYNYDKSNDDDRSDSNYNDNNRSDDIKDKNNNYDNNYNNKYNYDDKNYNPIDDIKKNNLEYLKERKIIEEDGDRILFTILFIIQNEGYLMQFDNVKKCKFCNILCFYEDEHIYCLKKYYTELNKAM